MKLYISEHSNRTLDNERLVTIEVNLVAPINYTYYVIESEEMEC